MSSASETGRSNRTRHIKIIDRTSQDPLPRRSGGRGRRIVYAEVRSPEAAESLRDQIDSQDPTARTVAEPNLQMGNTSSANALGSNPYTKLLRDFNEAKAENDKLQREVDLLSEELQRLQEKAFENMNQGRWTPQQDVDITDSLDRLNKRIRSWAKGMTTAPIDEILTIEPAKERNALVNSIGKVARLADGGGLPHHALMSGKSRQKLSGFLLMALLSHAIYSDVFENPFFFLDQAGSMEASGAFNKIYQELCEGVIKPYNMFWTDTDFLQPMHALHIFGGLR